MATRKSATNNGFLLFTDQLPILQCIPDESLGKAIKLLLTHFETMETIEEDNSTILAYELIATNIRRYRQQSVKAREDGLKGGNPTLMGTVKGTHKQQYNTIQEKKIKENIINLSKPTRKQLEDYERQICKHIGIDEFILYYDASDWCDKSGMPINWKQTALMWAKKNENEPKKKKVSDGLF